MRKVLFAILSRITPFTKLRHKFRHYEKSSYYNHGKNNIVELIYPDGTVRHKKYIPHTNIRFYGNNNTVRIYQPNSNLTLNIRVNHSTDITIGAQCYGSITIHKPKEVHSPIPNKLYIGGGSHFGGLTVKMLDSGGDVTIGENCMFSWNIEVRTSDGHTIYNDATGELINTNKGVTIGNHVWCGDKTIILKGAQVADNSIIGTRSLVTGKFTEPNSVIAGVPARMIKQGVNWTVTAPAEYQGDKK